MGCCVGIPAEVKNYDGFHDGELKNPPASTNAVDDGFIDKRGECATFGCGGDFHSAQARFSLIPGVIRTRVGYAGGTVKIDPASGTIKDHTAVVDVEFDPDKCPYELLLGHFWLTHDPMPSQGDLLHKNSPEDRIKSSRKRKKGEGEMKHHSMIFWHNEDQKRMAEADVITEDKERRTVNNLAKGHVQTDVVECMHVFPAELKDQHFFLQEDRNLMDIVNCNTLEEMMYSHFACKLDGFCTPLATAADLENYMDEFEDVEGVINYLQEKLKYVD